MTTPRRSAPLLRVFDRLTYPQKFVLISLLFLLPLAGFAPLAIQQYERIRDYGAYERFGTLYLRPLQKLLIDIQAHDATALAVLQGESPASDLTALQIAIDQDLEVVRAQNNEHGTALTTDKFNPTEQLATLQTRWDALKSTATTLSAADSQQQHSAITQDIRAYISGIGDTSFLILDPDLDTYYIMDIILLRAPETQNLIAEAARLGSEVARDRSRSFEQLKQLVQHTDRLASNLAGLRSDVEVALENNASGSFNPYSLPDSVNTAVGETQKFVDLLNDQLVNAETITVTSDEIAAAAQRAAGAQASFYNKASDALLVGIQARENRYTQTLVIGLAIALGGISVGFVLGLLVMLAISRPLSELTSAAQRLGAGDLSVRVTVANGDEAGKVGHAFNDFIDTLSTIVRGLVDNSTKLSSSATQLAATTAELSAGAESQTQQVIRTSTAMEEMSATIKDMARNANTTSVAAESAVQRALLGSAKVQAALNGITQTNHTLQQLQERSAEIDAVVRLIADIAAQTNILALNAAIEAAGAGAAGARFDVVAEEIRKLAGRTAESTARISSTVAEVQRQIQAGAAQMSETATQAAAVEQALSEIVDGITSVNDMVTLVSTSTTQQAKAADQVAESLQLITQVSQQTAEAMRESTSTIDDLSTLARGMNVTASRFKT